MIAFRPRRLLRWALWLLLVLVVLFAAALFIAPRLLDVPTVRAELERQVSRAAQGQVTWDELQVRVFPVPHGILRGARIEIPNLVTGRVDEVEVDLSLRALLKGQVEVSGVRVVRPVFRVTIAPAPPAPNTPSPPTPDPVSAYRQAMEPVAKALRAMAADMTLSIDNADLFIEAPAVPLSLALNLSARGHTDAGGADFSVTASGDLAKQLNASARIEYSDLRARATVDAVELKPQALLDLALAGTPVSLQLASGNLHAEVNSDGRAVLKVTATADASVLAVVLQKSRLDLDSVHAEATIVLKGWDVDIVLASVRAGELVPAGSAKLFFPAGNDPSEFSVLIPELDLARVRDAVLAIAGDIPPVRTYVGAIKGGRATDVTFSSKALSAGDWFDPGVFTASLKVDGAAILAPVIAKEVTGIAGQADWNRGTLAVRTVAGQLGNARISDGSFDYQLGNGTMSAAAGYDIDLPQALDLVRRSLAPGQRAQLNVIQALTGRAQGRFGFQLPKGQWSVDLAISHSDAALRLRDVPWPVSLRGGRVTVTPKRLTVAGASGAVGLSTFNQVGANLAIDGPMRIEAAQGHATLALAELYQWLRTQKGLEASLRDIPTVTGKADVTVNRIAGRLDALDALDYDVTVQPRQVLVELKELPAPATADGGSIRITPRALKIGGVNVALLDLRARVSGLLRDYRTKALQADMAVADGMVGEKFMQWVWERGKIPARYEPALPIGFSASHVRWSKAAGLDLQANLRTSKGANVDADLALAGDIVNVRSLRIRDAESDATLGLLTRGRLLDASFSGKLTGQTVAGLLKSDLGKRPGSVTGNIRATLDRDMRGHTTAQGNLKGQDIDLRLLTGKPLTMPRVELDAEGNRLHVSEATLNWAEQQATIRGDVRFTPGGPVIDAQVDSPGVVVDALLPPGPEATREPAEPSRKKTPEALEIWPLPVTGTLNVRAGFIEYERYRVEPVAAKLVLEPERARMTATEAAVCGVSFPFSLDFTPQGTVASVELLAKDQQLGATTRCLTSERVLLTGTYNLSADLRTHGRPDNFVKNLEGSVSLQARAGDVMKFALLGNILALKDVSNLFDKGGPDLRRAGFPYRTIVARGRFADGTFTVDQGAFDSDAVGLAATGTIGLLDWRTRLTVLVAPFSTLDRLARKVPLFGYIFGGALTSIPVGVSGDIRDPLVVPLGPGAVTKELVGIFERTMKLPSQMLEPLQKGAQPAQPPAAPPK